MTCYRNLRLVPLLAAVVLISACLAQPHPVKNIYSLLAEPLQPGEPTGPVTKPRTDRRTLLVGTVTAAAGFDNRALVYRVGEDRFETDFYNEFMAPPARLLADQTAQYLDDRNRRVRVVKTPGLIIAQFGLETYLEALYGDFTVEPPLAVVNIRFAVNDLRREAPRILMEKTYRQTVPLSADNNAEALVAAMNEGLNLILEELNRDIEKSIR